MTQTQLTYCSSFSLRRDTQGLLLLNPFRFLFLEQLLSFLLNCHFLVVFFFRDCILSLGSLLLFVRNKQRSIIHQTTKRWLFTFEEGNSIVTRFTGFVGVAFLTVVVVEWFGDCEPAFIGFVGPLLLSDALGETIISK